jgi:hypothetical protein
VLFIIVFSLNVIIFYPSAEFFPFQGRGGEGVLEGGRCTLGPVSVWLSFLVAVGSGGAIFFFRRRHPVRTPVAGPNHPAPSMTKGSTIGLWFANLAVAVLLVAAAVNHGYIDLSGPLFDAFHEGETIGLAPYLDSGDALPIVIHGPGRNLLPIFVAETFAAAGSTIAFNRFWVSLMTVIAAVAMFFVYYLTYRFYDNRKSPLDSLVILSGGLFLFLIMTRLFWLTDRVTVLYVQLSLAIGLLMSVREGWRRRSAVLALLLGCASGASVLYVYDRLVVSVAVLSLTGLSILAQQGRSSIRTFGWLLLGLVMVIGLELALLGPGFFISAWRDIVYWSLHGRQIWFCGIDHPIVLLLISLFAATLSVLAVAIVKDVLDGKPSGSVSKWWRDSGLLDRAVNAMPLVILLCVALLDARGVLDRANYPHMRISWGGLSILVGLWFAQSLRRWLGRLYQKHGQGRGLAILPWAILIGTFALWPPLQSPVSPVRAWNAIADYAGKLATPDSKIIRAGDQEAIRAMATDLENQTCFFTLTNEGAWYYFVNKPPCTRYFVPVFGANDQGERDMIEDLERTKPTYILYQNDVRSYRFDGVTMDRRLPAVTAYLASHYRPYRMIGKHWFWARKETANPPSGS